METNKLWDQNKEWCMLGRNKDKIKFKKHNNYLGTREIALTTKDQKMEEYRIDGKYYWLEMEVSGKMNRTF